eukprot:717679-Amphidinium_carterae.1
MKAESGLDASHISHAGQQDTTCRHPKSDSHLAMQALLQLSFSWSSTTKHKPHFMGQGKYHTNDQMEVCRTSLLVVIIFRNPTGVFMESRHTKAMLLWSVRLNEES